MKQFMLAMTMAMMCAVQDLARKSEEEREALLRKAGAAEETFADVHKMLMSLPHVHLSNVRAFVEEEEDVKEMDVLTVEVRACRVTSHAPHTHQ